MASLWKWLAVLTFSFCLSTQAQSHSAEAKINFSKKKIQVENKVLSVEIAESEAQHERGLMFREKLGKNDGMLFIFNNEEPRAFWMKNTLVNLSIGYYDKNRKLVDIQEMKA